MSANLQHKYLLKTGLWEVSGLYYDRNDQAYAQKGQLVITHEPDLWVIEGQMTIVAQETQTVSSRYEIKPLPQGGTYTEWKSETGGPEPVFGLFVMVADTILSPWQSRSNTYWGQEVLMRLSEGEYHGRGFAFLQNEKVSAWSTRLEFMG